MGLHTSGYASALSKSAIVHASGPLERRNGLPRVGTPDMDGIVQDQVKHDSAQPSMVFSAASAEDPVVIGLRMKDDNIFFFLFSFVGG